MTLVASCCRLPTSGSGSGAAVAGLLVAALKKPRSTVNVPLRSLFSSSGSSVGAVDALAATDGCPFGHGAVNRAATETTSTASKPFSQIPRPRSLPILGTLPALVARGGAPRIHDYCDRRHRELGPIYRERLGAVDAVFVADTHMIQKVYSTEGKYPVHMVPEPWIIYNEATGVQRGLFFMDGPLWNDRRKSLNKVFLKTQVVSEHSDSFSDVIADLLDRWCESRDPDGTLPDLEKELYNWSIESLGAMIFGRRLGCVPSGGPSGGLDLRNGKSIHEFVHCVQQIFTESARMSVIPPRLAFRFRLPVWRRFSRAADRALQLAREYVQENMASEDPSSGILGQVLMEGGISEEEIVRIVTDLFLAAADTTSHATQWTLHLLAKNPGCQTRLLEEAQTATTGHSVLGEAHLAQMPYLKAIIKESLRLYPVAPFLTRLLSSDLELDGYHIPAGTLVLMSVYTTGRDPKNFVDPEQFKPERWLRKRGSRDVISTHACLPFGLGARSCIGRRVAEIQMQLLLAKTVQRFRLTSANERQVDIRMRMITTPSHPIRLRLEDRS